MSGTRLDKKPSPSLLLYSLNYSPELTGIGKYNGEMVSWLAARGENVKVICASPYYPEWAIHDGFPRFSYRTQKSNNIEVTYCPHYVPKQVTTLKRLLHLASFSITSTLPLFAACFRKPKVMMVLQPTLFGTPMALLFCKLFGIRSILHIQDFEIDAMFGLGMSAAREQSTWRKAVFAIERMILKQFDTVSTISNSMLAKAKAKGVPSDRLMLFPNWSDTEFVNPNVSGDQLRAAWGFKANDKIVLYAGNVGAKQGLEMLIDVAEDYRYQKPIKFLIVGSGAYSDELKAMAKAKGLTNIIFKPLQPWETVPAMLAMADVHLVIQKKGVADAVLPSKLTNILSAGGHAVITAEADTELGRIATKFPGIYSCVTPENKEAFISGLNTQLELSSTQRYNTVARRFAETNLNQEAILNQFWSDVDAMTDDKMRTNTEQG